MNPNHMLDGHVGVRRSLRSGGASFVIHRCSNPVQRCAPNPAVNRTACKLRLQVPSASGSSGRLLLR
jgi:hypothetical protein